jgi:predicted nucleic acid-binding Zn ribbon protein
VVVFPLLCLLSGIVGGIIGQRKGSSYIVWFLISAIVPVLGPLMALLYRRETEVPLRRCPSCGTIVRVYDAMCMRCGHDLEYPRDSEIIEPTSELRIRAKL